MVKTGPASKKREVMLEILNLLSKRPHGFRELHRALPKEHRAGSFATLSACINLLKSEGCIEKDPETKKLHITTKGNLERKKQFVIKEINEAKMVTGRTSSSDTSPIRYEWSLAKHCDDPPRSINLLCESFRADPIEANLSFLSHFLGCILENGDNDSPAGQKQTLDYAWDRLRSELPVDVEVLNIVSIDTKRLLTWLKTPSGVATLEYVLEQKREGRMENIARLAKRALSIFYRTDADPATVRS